MEVKILHNTTSGGRRPDAARHLRFQSANKAPVRKRKLTGLFMQMQEGTARGRWNGEISDAGIRLLYLLLFISEPNGVRPAARAGLAGLSAHLAEG